jgi:hypothetical protein
MVFAFQFILEKTGERPSHRTNLGNLVGDSITFYEKKLEVSTKVIDNYNMILNKILYI